MYANHSGRRCSCLKNLVKREDKSIPTDLLVKLKKLILTRNILEFDKDYWIQIIGVAMGVPSAPTYANIFMAMVDIWLENFAIDEKTLENLILFIKRFIDDYLIFWTGSEAQLLKFMEKINQTSHN